MISVDNTTGTVSISFQRDYLLEDLIRKLLEDGYWVHVKNAGKESERVIIDIK